MTAYEAILDNAVMRWTAGEARRCYSALSEKHLQVLWWEQRWLRPLTTTEGLAVEVMEPGEWNGGSGPDFINARLSINGVALVGDVEVHLHQEGWYAHNHHLDSRYLRLFCFRRHKAAPWKKDKVSSLSILLNSCCPQRPEAFLVQWG